MSNRREGGLKAKATMLEKDPDYYKKLGRAGGSVKVSKGFGKNRELASKVGKIGGSRSRR